MGATLFGNCLYGSEYHYITERQFTNMRRVMCTALGDKEDRRPDSGRLFVVGAGEWDPEVARAKRLVKHWQKEANHHDRIPDYWDSLAETGGKL